VPYNQRLNPDDYEDEDWMPEIHGDPQDLIDKMRYALEEFPDDTDEDESRMRM